MDYPLQREWDILDVLRQKSGPFRIVILTPDSIKRHPLVIISCIWLPCIETTGNHSLLFSNRASVLLLSLPHTPLPLPERSPIPIFIQKHYLLTTLSCQHLSLLFTLPDARGSMKWKLFSRAHQLELCSLTFNVNMFHPQRQLCSSLLVALPSSILCLHGFSFSINSFLNFLPPTAPFFPHLFNPSPVFPPLQLGMQLPHQKPGKGKPCSFR